MTKLKVIVADTDRDFCNSLRASLTDSDGFELLAVTDSGVDAMEKVQRYQPDILICDLILPGIDGFELIARVRKLTIAKKPKIIVVSRLSGENFISKALGAGATYFMAKPVDISTLRERMLDFSANRAQIVRNSAYSARRSGLDEKLSNIFITVGIPAHIKGYQYLREAIKMSIDNPEIINSITKKLYPGIAERFNTSASKVERAIRHAIEVAWNRGKIENINSIFGIKIYSPNDKPTNGEFIALLADKMILEGA